MANTLSNLFTVSLALGGSYVAFKEGMPTRYVLGHLGIALIAVGSILFHATLLFEAQLADELPMVYVASLSLWLLFDISPGFGLQTRTKLIIALLVFFDVFFTWSYVAYRDPIYHQSVFGSIVFVVVARTNYILQWSDMAMAIPAKTKASMANFFNMGLGMFLLGFLVWNMDNIFCSTLTKWKMSIGWPAAFFLEGHSWWHILTGLGTYYMFIAIKYTNLCVKDRPEGYTVTYSYGIPFVRRLRVKCQ
jgi:dihydroceramidase